MPRWECDSSNEYSEEPSTHCHLATLLDQFPATSGLTHLEAASYPPAHMEEMPQLAEGLQHLAVVLWLHPNPHPKEEPMHTTMQENITMTLLQDIPTFDGRLLKARGLVHGHINCQ